MKSKPVADAIPSMDADPLSAGDGKLDAGADDGGPTTVGRGIWGRAMEPPSDERPDVDKQTDVDATGKAGN